MPGPVFDPNQPFTAEEAPTTPVPAVPTAPTRVPDEFTEDQYQEYTRLVRNPRTTPEQLSGWFSDAGLGSLNNAQEVIDWARRYPTAPLSRRVRVTQAEDAAPEAPAEHGWHLNPLVMTVMQTALRAGIISPETYDRVYTPNNDAPTISNHERSLIERVATGWDRAHSRAGRGEVAAVGRGLEDLVNLNDGYIAAQLGGTDAQREAYRDRRSRDDVIATRQHWDQQDAGDPNWREDGTLLGNLARSGAELLGDMAGNANPTYLIGGPAGRGVGAIARRMAVMGAVNAATDAGVQGYEMHEGVQDEFDPMRTLVQFGVGSVMQGGVEAARPLARALVDLLSPAVRAIIGKFETNGVNAEAMMREGFDLSNLPEGVTPQSARTAIEELKSLRDEAAAFQPSREPTPDDLFHNPERDAQSLRDLEARLTTESQPFRTEDSAAPAPEQAAPETPPTESAPALSRKEAEAAFAAETAPRRAQTTREWERSLKAQAEEFTRSRANPQTAEATVDNAAPTTERSSVTNTPTTETPQFEGDVVDRLTTALNDAGRASREQQARVAQDRSEKMKRIARVRQQTNGESGLAAELAQLRGEAPQADFEGVRGQFTQQEVDGLFTTIRDHPDLRPFESINARVGLTKLLDGGVPTASELNLLARVLPPQLIKAALKNRNTGVKLADFAGNALNLPRSMMSTLDLSAPLRQGITLATRRQYYTAFASMFKYYGSERAFQGLMQDIRTRPTYDLMDQSGLSLTDLGHDLTTREEAFMSQWAERIPGYGRAVRASERGFSGFLNKLRADTFDDLVARSQAAGVDFTANPKALTDIASFVNAATGRGSLHGLESSAPLLNGLFFSPRLISSRLTLLNPVYYARLSPVVRQEALKSVIGFGALATSILTMFSMGGADVETDMRSSDFGKIKIGNTRFDILGGFGQYITFGARLATNETMSRSGNVRPLDGSPMNGTRKTVTERFVENKFSPVAGYIRDFLQGSDPVGNPFNPVSDTAQLFIPLVLQDLYSIVQDGGIEAAPKIIPGIFGAGVSTYGDKPKFDPKQPATAEPASDEATSSEEGPSFDPNQAFDTSTVGNLQAVDILSGMGLQITDEGVRSEEEQRSYYNNTAGAAPPGSSPHEAGNAVDVRVPQGVKPSDIVAELRAQGFRGVTIITKRHGTGPHWHIQWDSAGE